MTTRSTESPAQGATYGSPNRWPAGDAEARILIGIVCLLVVAVLA